MKKSAVVLLAMMMLLAGCGGGRRAEMRERLQALNALNRADTVLTATHRDEAQELADWFDRHGSANEQMLAHYLLGRCYADMHEAPMALHCYQEAISRADTTSADCDFAQLSRVYGQSATIFYQQGLYRNSLEYYDMSSEYGWHGKDTLAALRSYAMKGADYDQLQMKDSAILIYKNAVELLKLYKYNKVAAGFSGAIAKKLIDKGEMSKALPYLQEYERNSGYFNYWKGLYYLQINQLDSAEYYFRKELRTGKDFNNQSAGAYGLSLLYSQRHIPDSAAKYALYYSEMNDSMYAHKATQEVEQAKAMYDYTRQEQIALQEKNRADNNFWYLRVIAISAFTLLVLAIFAIYGYKQQKRKRQQLQMEYDTVQSDLTKLGYLKDELIRKNLQCENLQSIIEVKENVAKQLEEKYGKFLQMQNYATQRRKSIVEILSKEKIYQKFIVSAKRGKKLSEEEWETIEAFLMNQSPAINHYIEEKKVLLSPNEYKTAVLTCLYISPIEISHLIGVDKTYISKYRASIAKKLFGGNSSRDLDLPLLNLCWPQEDYQEMDT